MTWEEWSEQRVEGGFGDLLGADVELVTDPGGFEDACAVEVVEEAPRIVVHPAVDLEDEPKLVAVEVDDEAAEDLLAPELQPEASSVAKKLPRPSLRRRRSPTKPARHLPLLGGNPGITNERRLISLHTPTSTRSPPSCALSPKATKYPS